MAVLEQLSLVLEHSTNVYKKRPLKAGNGAAWRKALKRAGITKTARFRFHDLRHTFATCHGERRRPLQAEGSRRLEVARDTRPLREDTTAQLVDTSNIIDGVMPAAPKKLKLVVNQ